jgi:DtxR family Mn-dependent transcriptional regulator
MKKKTIEDYVEKLYDLQKENKLVHTNDVANLLNINPASVTEIFQKLSKEGYVNYKKYSGVTLTEKGKKLAISTRKRHEKLKEFLILLGIDKKIAEEDACEMEHILHKKTMDAVVKFVDVINQCGVTPFWLNRLKKYINTDELDKCPKELVEICLKYNKK